MDTVSSAKVRSSLSSVLLKRSYDKPSKPEWFCLRDTDRLVEHYAPMVKRMALQMAVRLPANIMLDDLIQYGMMGLIEALERYEVQEGASFETYAVARVRGAILDALRRTDYLSRTDRQAMREIEEAIGKLSHELGRPPRDSEVARALGWTVEKYQEVLSSAQGHTVLLFDDLDDGESGFLEHHFADTESPEEIASRRELKEKIVAAIEKLPRREQFALALHFEHDLNLKEIGAALGISESGASRLISVAIARIRASLREEKLIA